MIDFLKKEFLLRSVRKCHMASTAVSWLKELPHECLLYCRKCCTEIPSHKLLTQCDDCNIATCRGCGLPTALSWVSMEHAGENGVHLSVGAEMEAHSDQAAHT